MKRRLWIKQEELAALQALKNTGVDVLEAALVAREALQAGRGRVRRARACIAAGVEELRRREKTVTFERAVEVALEARADRRKRTVVDFRYLTRRAGHERICPPNWCRRWAGLHRAAGFPRWQQDVLRHTFATHHLTTFRNYAELQLEMGHRSATLLRTRYIAMHTGCDTPAA